MIIRSFPTEFLTKACTISHDKQNKTAVSDSVHYIFLLLFLKKMGVAVGEKAIWFVICRVIQEGTVSNILGPEMELQHFPECGQRAS